jgi:hypothetical protein
MPVFLELLQAAIAAAPTWAPQIEEAFADVFARHPEMGPPPRMSERAAIDADFDRQIANESK